MAWYAKRSATAKSMARNVKSELMHGRKGKDNKKKGSAKGKAKAKGKSKALKKHKKKAHAKPKIKK